ncbi:MAG TPA: glutamyl-tRNA reductase [Candidatus Binatia bacterium]|nr:glutamyl-tRNA reductase [Candidatus Binatia bacterium]
MEPTLAVIGLNFRTSPVAVRERFWISPNRRRDALDQLVRSEGIEEVIVLATCNRTEFILWASDVPVAANSVLRFLSQEYELKLGEWSHFYRLMDDGALSHVFRVTSGLDSMVLGEPEITGQVKEAWLQAQEAGTTGRFLDAVMQKALTVSKRARTETAIGSSATSVPYASVELSRQILGELSGREVLLIGAGKMSELAAHYLMKVGAHHVKVTNRTACRAEELAARLGATSVPFDERLQHLMKADIVVSSTSCPHLILGREDAENIARERGHRPIVMIDIAVPRDIDPTVRGINGIHLFDMDDLEHVVRHNAAGRQAAAEAAEKIVQAEVQGFRRKLMAERVVPVIVALRQRLDELCRQELEVLRKEFGPFTEDQDQVMAALTTHITQRIAGSLARELKELPEKAEQDILAGAVDRLFHLERRATATADAAERQLAASS